MAFLFLGTKFRTSIRMLVDKCFKLLNHSKRGGGGLTQQGYGNHSVEIF
jgi:hypothetical protein